jgi:hypothetical protein
MLFKMKKKVKADILCIIYSLDRVILNDFFVSLAEYYERTEEPLDLKGILPKCDIDNILSLYKKFIPDADLSNVFNQIQNIIFPFDIFGTDGFLKSLLKINAIHKELIEKLINKLN